MDTLQCAIVLAKLERFEWEIARRKELGARYGEALRANGAPVEPIAVRADRDCVWAPFTVQTSNRDALASALREKGIPTAIHYPMPLHHQPAYAAYGAPDACPESVYASKRVLSLPMSADLEEQDLRTIVDACAQSDSFLRLQRV
jgi:UDP-2-acetamido-2-deoxy-ribo-hexuluronate aminotransferase